MKNNKKRCKHCEKIKNLNEFSKDKTRKGTIIVRPECKSCRVKYQKEWYSKQEENYRKYRGIKRNYGIKKEDYNFLFSCQKGMCAICKKRLEHNRTSVDHNHKTNEIRGLLCINCNAGLGLFRDNLQIIKNAIKYLGENGSLYNTAKQDI